MLFPLLRTMEQGRETNIPFPIDRPIRCMTEEHAAAGESLEQFRRLTDGYTVPDGACTSWRVLVADLARLERDMHEHVHKENNLLFPKALAATTMN